MNDAGRLPSAAIPFVFGRRGEAAQGWLGLLPRQD
jgi:hypothetical protein